MCMRRSILIAAVFALAGCTTTANLKLDHKGVIAMTYEVTSGTGTNGIQTNVDQVMQAMKEVCKKAGGNLVLGVAPEASLIEEATAVIAALETLAKLFGKKTTVTLEGRCVK